MRDRILDGPTLDQGGCHLLKLPLELRMRILQYVCPAGQYLGVLMPRESDRKPKSLYLVRKRNGVSFTHWDMLMRYIFYQDGDTQIVRRRPENDFTFLLSIAQTCRMLYREVIPLMYGNDHIFAFSHRLSLLKFLSLTPSSHLQYVGHIIVQVHVIVDGRWRDEEYGNEWIAAADTLRGLPRLRTLEIQVHCEYLLDLLAGHMVAEQLDAAMAILRPFSRRRGDRVAADSRWIFFVRGDDYHPIQHPALLEAAVRDEEIPFEVLYNNTEQLDEVHQLALELPQHPDPLYYL